MADEQRPVSPLGGFLFPNIFRSFRMAIQPSRLAIAFAAVAVICLTGLVMDLAQMVILAGRGPVPPENVRAGVFASLWHFADARVQTTTSSLLTLDLPSSISNATESAYQSVYILGWLFRHHTIYSVVFFAIVLVVLSLTGGALCRMTALQFALGKRMGLGSAWRFARTRFRNLVAAPVAPLIIALLLGLPIIVLGALGNIPYAGELITALFLPLALILAPFIAVLLIGVVTGSSLLFPAVAYEDSDFFDAASRSFGNVYARPWHMAFYALTAAVYGAACYLFVRFFAFLLLWVTRGFLQIGLHDEKLQALWPAPSFADFFGAASAAPETWSLWLAAILIRVCVLAVVGLTISFLISFYFTAGTIIYALMRHRVDGTPLNEICETPEETLDAAGRVPEVSPGTSPDLAVGQAGGTSE